MSTATEFDDLTQADLERMYRNMHRVDSKLPNTYSGKDVERVDSVLKTIRRAGYKIVKKEKKNVVVR